MKISNRPETTYLIEKSGLKSAMNIFIVLYISLSLNIHSFGEQIYVLIIVCAKDPIRIKSVLHLLSEILMFLYCKAYLNWQIYG